MHVSKLLTAIATWLENPNNAALTLVEDNDKMLEAVATSLVSAGEILRMGAETALQISPEANALTPEKLDELNAIITAFDLSGDPELQKTASVLDELLMTVCAPSGEMATYKQAQMDRLDVLKRDYEGARDALNEANHVKESLKAIEKSPFFEKVRIMDHALNTRTCPDHPGAQMARVGEAMWQCAMDKKVFNYTSGYITERGEKVPGQSVSAETPDFWAQPQAMFDTRQDRLSGGFGAPAGGPRSKMP